MLGDEDVMQAFQIQRLAQVDLDDHLVRQNRKAGAVAHRCGGDDGTGLGDGHRLDDGQVNGRHLPGAQQLHRFGQVLIHKHHLSAVDGRAQHRVGLKWQAACQHTGLGQCPVHIATQ